MTRQMANHLMMVQTTETYSGKEDVKLIKPLLRIVVTHFNKLSGYVGFVVDKLAEG
jgi:hypothetical protein